MPRAVDKIRSYIKHETGRGKLYPGKRLPSYSDMQDQFGFSYATVQNSMRRLQAEKFVDIVNGKGCYIATPKTLKIAFYLPETTLNFPQLQQLFDKHLDKSLRVEVELREWQRYEIKPPDNETHTIIIGASYNSPFSIPGLSSFEFFDGFDKLLNQLQLQNSGTDNAFYIPFYRNVSQLGINLDLLDTSGFSINDLSNDFDWWDDLNTQNKIKSAGIAPSSFYCNQQYPWWFGYFLPLFANLLINETQSPAAIYKTPLFDTPSGSKLLDIIASHRSNQANNLFYSNKSIIELSAGTWLTMQNKTREDFLVENFIIKPYKFNDRKICLLGQNCLQTFMHHDLDNDDRNRIWEVVKMLLSKPFQLDFCNLSGMLSVRRDVAPDEYIWNNRPDFAAFIPEENDIKISGNIFPSHYLATIAALIEQYTFYNADKQTILRQLDKKVTFNTKPKIT
jgi:DNA-binding transcriptional regulator YhcF (GntR family)